MVSSGCVRLYQEAHNRTIVRQQQLDDANAKLLAQFEVQNAKILNLENQVKKSQAISDREQAMDAGVVPSRHRSPISRRNNSQSNYLWLAQIFSAISL